MPVLEYRCLECGRAYEVFHKVREILSDIVCPSCSSTRHKKLISVPAPAARSSSGDQTCGNEGCCRGTCGLD